jgi:hypothetical protein
MENCSGKLQYENDKKWDAFSKNIFTFRPLDFRFLCDDKSRRYKTAEHSNVHSVGVADQVFLKKFKPSSKSGKKQRSFFLGFNFQTSKQLLICLGRNF